MLAPAKSSRRALALALLIQACDPGPAVTIGPARGGVPTDAHSQNDVGRVADAGADARADALADSAAEARSDARADAGADSTADARADARADSAADARADAAQGPPADECAPFAPRTLAPAADGVAAFVLDAAAFSDPAYLPSEGPGARWFRFIAPEDGSYAVDAWRENPDGNRSAAWFGVGADCRSASAWVSNSNDGARPTRRTVSLRQGEALAVSVQASVNQNGPPGPVHLEVRPIQALESGAPCIPDPAAPPCLAGEQCLAEVGARTGTCRPVPADVFAALRIVADPETQTLAVAFEPAEMDAPADLLLDDVRFRVAPDPSSEGEAGVRLRGTSMGASDAFDLADVFDTPQGRLPLRRDSMAATLLWGERSTLPVSVPVTRRSIRYGGACDAAATAAAPALPADLDAFAEFPVGETPSLFRAPVDGMWRVDLTEGNRGRRHTLHIGQLCGDAGDAPLTTTTGHDDTVTTPVLRAGEVFRLTAVDGDSPWVPTVRIRRIEQPWLVSAVVFADPVRPDAPGRLEFTVRIPPESTFNRAHVWLPEVEDENGRLLATMVDVGTLGVGGGLQTATLALDRYRHLAAFPARGKLTLLGASGNQHTLSWSSTSEAVTLRSYCPAEECPPENACGPVRSDQSPACFDPHVEIESVRLWRPEGTTRLVGHVTTVPPLRGGQVIVEPLDVRAAERAEIYPHLPRFESDGTLYFEVWGRSPADVLADAAGYRLRLFQRDLTPAATLEPVAVGEAPERGWPCGPEPQCRTEEICVRIDANASCVLPDFSDSTLYVVPPAPGTFQPRLWLRERGFFAFAADEVWLIGPERPDLPGMPDWLDRATAEWADVLELGSAGMLTFLHPESVDPAHWAAWTPARARFVPNLPGFDRPLRVEVVDTPRPRAAGEACEPHPIDRCDAGLYCNRDPANSEQGVCGPLVLPEIHANGGPGMPLHAWVIGDPFTLADAEITFVVLDAAGAEISRIDALSPSFNIVDGVFTMRVGHWAVETPAGTSFAVEVRLPAHGEVFRVPVEG